MALSLQGTVSAFGAFLDPVADKLMVATVLILLSTQALPAGPWQGNTWLIPVLASGECSQLDSRTRLSSVAQLPCCLADIPNHYCCPAQVQRLLTTQKPANGIMALPAAIIGREIAMSALREWAASSSPEAHQAVAVSSWGKWKTALQVSAATRSISICPNLPNACSCASGTQEFAGTVDTDASRQLLYCAWRCV